MLKENIYSTHDDHHLQTSYFIVQVTAMGLINLFLFIRDGPDKYATVLVPGNPLQPSLTFVGKTRLLYQGRPYPYSQID